MLSGKVKYLFFAAPLSYFASYHYILRIHSDTEESDEEWGRLLREPTVGVKKKETYVGKYARAEFYRLFRTHNYSKIPRPPSARSIYLKQCDIMGICPEPMGIIRRSDTPSLELRNYRMGDRVAKAFADSLALVCMCACAVFV